MTNLHISRMTIHRLALPFRRQFSHAAAERAESDDAQRPNDADADLAVSTN